MVTVRTSSINDPGMGTSHGTRVQAASLLTGELLWDVTTDDITFSTSTGVADHGKYTVRMLGGWWDAWNLDDGSFAWKSDVLEYPGETLERIVYPLMVECSLINRIMVSMPLTGVPEM